MATFQPTSKKKENSSDVFQPTNRRSYDSTVVYGWETANKQAFDILNDYNNRINKSEWLSKEDRDNYRKALDTYIETTNHLRGLNKTLGEGYSDEDEKKWNDSIAAINKGYDEISNYYSQFADDREYNNWYAKETKRQEYESTRSAEDFEEYSYIGAGVANPDWESAHAPFEIFGWKPFGDGETVNNMVTFAETNKSKAYQKAGQNALSGNNLEGTYTDLVILMDTYMKPEEKAIYNYYVGKGDTEKANEYMAYVTDLLRQRQAGTMVEQADNNALEALYSAVAGIDQFASGIKNIDNFIMGTESDPTTAIQYAHGTMSGNNEGVWKVTNDLLYTTGNMLPSIGVSVLADAVLPGSGSIFGAVTMGAGATGNAYAEMRNLGYDEWQSRGYALLVGASEAALSYALGGISKLGGKVTGNAISKFVARFNSAIAKTAITLGGNMASEGLEEAIQTVLEPAFKALVTGEEFEAPEWEDVWYSALLGALSAGALEGVPTIAGNIDANYKTNVANGGLSNMGAIKAFAETKSVKGVAEAYKAGKQNVTESAGAYVNEALEIDPDNAHAQRMQARINEGKNVSGYQINRLVEANENALVSQDVAKIKAAAEAQLTKLGETGDISKIAEAIAKHRSGEKLTKAEKALIANSKYGSRVSNGLNPDYINSGEYDTSWAETIGTERINNEAYNRGLSEADRASRELKEMDAVTENTPIKENATVSEISAPVDDAKKAVAKATMLDNEGNTVEANVAKIAEVENGEATLELEGGQTVKASDVDFGDSGIGLVYKAATEMVSGVGGFNVDAANLMVKGFNPNGSIQAAGAYVSGFNEAYRYGAMGYPVTALETGNVTSKLSVAQREVAYNLGKAYGNEKVALKQAKIDSTVSIKAGKDSKKATKKGKVYFDGSAVGKTLTERQRASLKGLRVIAEAMGIDIYIFESKVGKDGKRQGANGWYDPSDNSIHLDLHAGVDGNGLMLYTAAHELAHYMREMSPEKFKIFADALLEEYAKNGVSIDALISRKLETLEANRRLEGKTKEEAYDLAYEEVVADASEAMLVDSDAIEALSRKIQAKDKGLWETIKDFFAKLVARIKAAYEGIDPDSREGKLVREMTTSAERLQKLWVDALLEASEVNTVLGENGIIVNSKTDSASLMSVRDVLTDADRKKVSKTLAERFGVTQTEAMDWLKAETSLASLILNPKYSQYLDYTADPNEDAIKSNSDYPQGTVDFSNICKKRRDFTEVMNRVLRNFPNHVFAATDLAKIRTIMEQEGMEVACAICYVEDRRQLDGPVAQDFIDSLKIYREGGKNRPDGKPFNANQLKAFSLIEGDTYTPTIYELVSLKGRNSLKAKNPAMEEAWVKFNNARGMQSVRLLLNDAEYKRQILKYSPTVVARKNDHGGLRIYSFSDMEMFHLIDIIQVITDSATVGLSIQGYTKVNEYAKAVKDTGEKLNRSLIPKGDLGYHIENGRVVLDFDTVEGIDINHPDFFDNIDNPNIGNIIIGINATQIKAAMASKFIDQIIPFHTGQSSEVLGEKGIAAWENYKDYQSERDVKTQKKSSHQINIYTEVIKAAEAEGKPITNKVEFVNKFLEVCKENNLIPRFSEFLNVDENGNYVYTEGYHKFLVDFKTFDQNTGEYLPQMPVKPIFDNEYLTKLLTDYVKTQKTKDAELAKTMPKVLDRITKEIVKPGEMKYSDRDTTYLDAVNRGDMETAQRMVDEAANKAGYTYKGMHGTDADFNKFDYSYIGDDNKLGLGFYFTNNEKLQFKYDYEKNAYLKFENPIFDNNPILDDILRREVDLRESGLSQEETLKKIQSEFGYDGIIAEYNRHALVAFNPEQIKSADPVTYDDDGNVIPLSERFKSENSDIRYSDRDSHDNKLTAKQQEFFKESKARDEDGNLLVLYHGTSTEQRITEFKTTEGWRTGLWMSTDHATAVHFARAMEYVENDPSDETKLFTKENSSNGTGRQGVYELYANVKNPLIVDANNKRYWEIPRPAVMGKGDAVSGEEINAFAAENGYDGVIIENVIEGSNRLGTDVIVFSPNQAKYTDNLNPTEGNDIRYSDRTSYAPTFYSHMGKVIDDIKLEKMGTSNILNHLKNRGVKAEEIKWSGIETFLEGKKSVSKAELQEFAAGSQLHIEEELSGRDIELRYDHSTDSYTVYDGNGDVVDTYTYDSDRGGYTSENDDEVYEYASDIEKEMRWVHGTENAPRHSQYKLDGGTNYRELVFKMPDSSYSNKAMRGHWGQEAEGVLAHARMQDFEVNGKKMLFIEEIQSDWHNEGARDGYVDGKEEAHIESLKAKADEAFIAVEDYSVAATGMAGEWEVIEKTPRGVKLLREYREAQAAYDNAMNEFVKKIPDAPFRDNYHEYVLKRLLRMAAEEGYDSIGWTPSEIQSDRWSEEFAEAYRIEYDQDIPKFLRKYGKKWGATVGKASIDDTEVWSMDITDSMKESVLYEGQPLYQDRGTDSYSNRSLLAGALETAVQNDIEREKLRQYKQKIDLINSEEQKLHDLREQIKELSFKKGPRDTEAIRNLQFEASQAANRINTYDKQLLNLESTKALKGVLEREKAQARKRDAQKYKEALERQREKSAKAQRELMDRYQESRKRGTENRNKTAMRHKIKDVVNELNNYLLKGTKDKHVPIELQKAVAEALDAVNMDTVGAEQRIAAKRAEMMKAKTPEAVEKLAKEIETIQEMGGNMAKKIARLKTAYDSIINSDDPLVANSHDEVISNTIQRVGEIVGETPLRDMSLHQLEEVYDMYRMVLFTIRNANKAFKAKKSEEISVIANRVMEEVDALGKRKNLQSKVGETISSFDWNNQKPVYAFERIGSDTFTEVFNNVRAGEDTWARDMTEAQDFREEQYKKHNYSAWDFKKRFGFKSSSGMNFELTLDQIMSLYAYSKRDQAAEHLKRGGIVFDETTEVTVKTKLGIPVKFNPTQATAYNISDETLADIISKLTAEQKAFVDEMQDYLSTVMGEKGNEVSLELYGVKLFKEKHYFPLKSATQFMAKAKEQQKGEVKIKNSGFSKETVKKANNPIVLTPFMDVWAGHVNEMSMYHAFVLALEDFYRVYNYKTPTSETMATESVEMFLQNTHGKAATKYIDQLLKDLNGGARVDSTAGIINKLTGLFKKSAVFASASVVVQQPSAIARATALVDTKYFVGKPSKHKETWAEVKKYAPVAVIKEMGYFDTGMGKSSVEWLKGDKTLMDKIDDIASKAPALADEYAWCVIWNAVKRETVHNNPGLATSSNEFLTLVGERFTEVITKTQVYDSVLSRSANMRSKDTGMKMATAFMGEPTTSLNMLQDALIQGKRGNKKYAAKAIGGVISSMILNSILVSIVYAGRDDDEEKTYAEKYINTLTKELLDSFNPLTLIPFIKDIVSIAQGYDVERSDMAVITDLINAWNNLDSDNRSVYRKVEDFGGAIAAIFGLPVKNVMRDVRGMYNTINSFINGEKTTGAGIGNAITEAITGKEISNGNQLYEAILKGDTAQIKRIEGRFEDQKDIDSAIRKALRDNDPRIKEAAQAFLDGDVATYNKLREEIIAEGNFSRTLITDALKAEYNYLKNKAKEGEN